MHFSVVWFSFRHVICSIFHIPFGQFLFLKLTILSRQKGAGALSRPLAPSLFLFGWRASAPLDTRNDNVISISERYPVLLRPLYGLFPLFQGLGLPSGQ